ncbi:hypothetical protein Ahy_A08g040493 [Arachis hypogaea]|uniref:Aminotransferase-like plant mobile domain-containing protein n=1 Tax=Arachis hypogaea TaxID=3818 RepID=A0A445BZC3_ARAHY|nr:hypothetical protein Ahy_A08g040493 [Arachis hypogaea]
MGHGKGSFDLHHTHSHPFQLFIKLVARIFCSVSLIRQRCGTRRLTKLYENNEILPCICQEWDRSEGYSALLSALVERWRLETHSFVLSTGEITVTLEDMSYIFCLLGTTLFADKSTMYAHTTYPPQLQNFEQIGTYSRGSATLTHLYKTLCRASRWSHHPRTREWMWKSVASVRHDIYYIEEFVWQPYLDIIIPAELHHHLDVCDMVGAVNLNQRLTIFEGSYAWIETLEYPMEYPNTPPLHSRYIGVVFLFGLVNQASSEPLRRTTTAKLHFTFMDRSDSTNGFIDSAIVSESNLE